MSNGSARPDAPDPAVNGDSHAGSVDLPGIPGRDPEHTIELFITRFNAGHGSPVTAPWDVSKEDWQRYEFLGDRVLELVVAQALFRRKPFAKEGDLTRSLAGIVSNRSLAGFMRRRCPAAGRRLIPESIGKQGTCGDRIPAGAFEAFIGALYCERGFEPVSVFLTSILEECLADDEPDRNAIGILQEYWQKHGGPLPVYREVSRNGPDHRPFFVVSATTPDGRSTEGSGASLPEARREAALKALDTLRQR